MHPSALGSVLKLTYGIALIAGVALGLLGATPLLVMLHLAVRAKHNHSKAPSIPSGFVAMVVSALIIALGIALAHRFVPASFLELSVVAVLVMLVCVLAAGLAAWHSMTTSRRN